VLDLPPGQTGVLPNQLIEAAIATGVIDAGGYTIPRENISRPASTCGSVKWRTASAAASCRPARASSVE
jgi:hypothetical protein